MNAAMNWTNIAVDAVGWILIHSVWQVTIVYLLFLGATALAGSDARRRHAIGITALALIVVAGVATVCLQFRLVEGQSNNASSPAIPTSPELALLVKNARADEKLVRDWFGHVRYARINPSLHDRLAVAVEPALPWAVKTWFAGFVVLTALHAIGLWAICRSTRTAANPDAVDLERWLQIARSIGVHRLVRYGISDCVQVPMTVGWLKPAIYVPIQLSTHFSVEEIDAMVAHELAHIRRYDFFFNQIQVILESLLYFHPCMWLLSNRIRRDRELCCDAVAVTSCGDSRLFQKALVRLADLRWTPQWRLAPAIAGGSLVERVAALARPSSQVQKSPSSLVVAIVLGGACLAAMGND
ncbi:MAG: peptidase, partial [Phycisphaerales bacterium]|nr:peptidase [Phycisphaerales bacterium]